jgi:hypothetical protein
MMKPNANIQKELDALAAAWEAGEAAGYDAALHPLPEWYSTTPLIRLSPYQRAYWFGRELRLQEIKKAMEDDR